MAFSSCLEAGEHLPSQTVHDLMDSAEKLAAFALVRNLKYSSQDWQMMRLSCEAFA